jgi:hypothetical protein
MLEKLKKQDIYIKQLEQELASSSLANEELQGKIKSAVTETQTQREEKKFLEMKMLSLEKKKLSQDSLK